MKSRLRNVAGAYWRSSIILFAYSWNFGRRIAYGARVVTPACVPYVDGPAAVRRTIRACQRPEAVADWA